MVWGRCVGRPGVHGRGSAPPLFDPLYSTTGAERTGLPQHLPLKPEHAALDAEMGHGAD